MDALLDEKVRSVRDKVYAFGLEHIASRPDLHTQEEFPPDLWHEMGKQGLLGLAVPENFGGSGCDYTTTIMAGRSLTEGGKNLGCSLTWLMHQIIARFFVLEQGSSQQHETYLPAMARGEMTVALAVSESQGGGHPKYLKTFAEPDGSGYRITGEKNFVTNAPLADMFIVLAVADRDGDRKHFSAFLVPRDTQGLSMGDSLNIGFLHPCPHAGIILDRCPVPAEAVLGKQGSAYEDMVLVFREVEDAMMLGLISGGIQTQLASLVPLIQDRPESPNEDLDARLGEIASMLKAMELLTVEGGRLLDNKAFSELPPLLVFLRRLAAQIQTFYKELVDSLGIQTDSLYDLMTNDLVRTLRIAANVAALKQKKLGRSFLS